MKTAIASLSTQIERLRLSVARENSRTASPSRDQALKRDAVSRKFLLLVTPVLGRAAAEQLHQCITGLHALDSVKPLLDGAAKRAAAAA